MATAKAGVRAGGKIFYGWWIVLGSLVLQFISSGVYFYGFSVFFIPISSEFGWSRAETAGAFSLARLEGGPMAPIIGWLIDKIGPRKLMFFGITVAGIGFFLMQYVSSLITFYIIYGLIISVGFNTGFAQPMQASIANWFVRKRGRALSIYTLGAGLGGGIVVPVVALLIVNFGWRTTAIVIAGVLWLVGYPVASIVRHRPEQYGLLPDGDDPAKQNESLTAAEEKKDEQSGLARAKRSVANEAHFLASEALKTPAFWFLAVGSSMRALAMTSVVVHQVPFLVDIGISEQDAASALGMMTMISIIGRLFFGYIGDLVTVRYAIAVTMILQAIGIFIMSSATSINEVYWFLLFYGIGYGGSIPLQGTTIGAYFGRKSFASIVGIMQTCTMSGTVIGPIFAGYMFDSTGSYSVAFSTFVITYIVGAILYMFAKPPKPTEAQLKRGMALH